MAEDTKRLSMPVNIATDTIITAVTSYRTSYLTVKRRSPTNRARKSPIDRSHSMHPTLRRVCVGFFIAITISRGISCNGNSYSQLVTVIVMVTR